MNLHFDEINSNKFSNFGSPYKALNKEEKNMLGNLIDRTYESFLERVSKGRSISMKKLKKLLKEEYGVGRMQKLMV